MSLDLTPEQKISAQRAALAGLLLCILDDDDVPSEPKRRIVGLVAMWIDLDIMPEDFISLEMAKRCQEFAEAESAVENVKDLLK